MTEKTIKNAASPDVSRGSGHNLLNPEVIRDRLMVQYVRHDTLYASEDHWVSSSSDSGKTWKTVCRLERRDKRFRGALKDSLLRSAMIRKIRRKIGIHNVVVLPSGTILILYDGIYRYDGEGNVARFVFGFAKDGIIGPLQKGFTVDDRTGGAYFGEYNNERPYAVRIIRGTEDGTKWEICYQFPKGAVKHVHSIVPDAFRKRLWVCTGDNDRETGLFYTEDDFKTVQKFAGGSQHWRMVSLIPTADALYWGSDAGKDVDGDFVNHLYRWDFGENKLERLNQIGQPAYFSASLKDDSLVIGTTYEPGIRRQVQPSADLWYSRGGSSWEKIVSLPYKARRKTEGTRYALIHLPHGQIRENTVFFTPVNVAKFHYKLLSASIPQ